MKRYHQILLFLALTLLVYSCQSDDSDSVSGDTLFQRVASDHSGVTFVNEVKDGKDFNVLTYRNFYNGGGVGIGDINNDGLDDLFFTANANPNQLYLNKGDLKFEDISSSAGIARSGGWSTGVTMVDINADGYLDIYVSNSGDIAGDDRKNELYINNGDLTFAERAADYGLDNDGFTTHASFFDYDLDGDLDAYILNNSFKDPSKLPSFSKTREMTDQYGGDRLMRNDGGKFVDVSAEAGIYSSAIGFGLGVSVSDINGDYYPDIYISNDFWERDYIYINNGDGTFSEELPDRVSICSVSSMGADVADLNNDGHFDIYTTDMLAADNFRLKAHTVFDPVYLEDLKYRSSFHYQILQNCLQVNNGDGTFREMAHVSNAAATDWSWGALIFDFDNDGWNDIFVANGIYKDIMDLDFMSFIDDPESVSSIVKERGEFDFRDFASHLSSTPLSNYAFVNQKGNQFEDRAKELGLANPGFSNGSAYADLDNDGDLDLVINNVNTEADIYENTASDKGTHYVKIRLKDENGDNRNALGAHVKLSTADGDFYQQHYTARGFQSNVGGDMIFGLGDDVTSVESVEIVWPDLTVQRLTDIAIDQLTTITKESDEKLSQVSTKIAFNQMLTSSDIFATAPIHTENRFNDFDYERLLVRMYSTEGPKIETGDLNGDGLEDAVILGAKGDVDKVYIQNKSGKLEYREMPGFASDSGFESTCAALFDVDGDGDLDLTIGSGGNDFGNGMEDFLIRFYENDGKGYFRRNLPKSPPAGGQFSVIAPSDYDFDGDIDLFIGARSIPGNHGLTPRSFLLRKDGDKWQDVTTQEIGTVGMVTDADWSDIDQDGDMDLIMVGEYMPITIFVNEAGQLQRKVVIPDTEGWWLDINKVDIDQDGDDDFVVGNWGLNTKFKASKDKPISLYVKDFDDNGKSEFVLNWTPQAEEESYPFHTKMEITEQLPMLKKKYLKYKDYAEADYQDLFDESQKAGAIERKVVTLESAILYNEDGQLVLKRLPVEAQISPMFASVIDDFDGDGINDIWMSGNFYGLKPEVGRHDDSKGVLLKGSASGEFTYIHRGHPAISGEVRDAALIKSNDGKKHILIGVNNAPAQALMY